MFVAKEILTLLALASLAFSATAEVEVPEAESETYANTTEVSRLSILDPVCKTIKGAISSASDVYYFGHPLYFKGVHHWARSSSQLPRCVVEPGTAADVGAILKIVGSTRTPFAVKGGGHTSNPGFSSTTGVHISMYRFSAINYNAAAQTAEIGAGLVWDDVYEDPGKY